MRVEFTSLIADPSEIERKLKARTPDGPYVHGHPVFLYFCIIRGMFKQLLTSALALCFLLSGITAVQAEEDTDENTGPVLQGPAAVLIDQDSGNILYDLNSAVHRDPSSLTDLMAVYLAASSLNQNQSLTMSSAASATYDHSSGVLWIETGETLSALDCMAATLLAGANDTAAMLAEGVSGGNDDFLAAMNSQAESWNLADTHFDNLFGQASDNNYSSAADIARLTRQALLNSSFASVFSLNGYTIAANNVHVQAREIPNDCQLVRSGDLHYEGITGGKLGYSESGGYGISASAQRDGTRLIAVVLGEESSEKACADIAALFDYGFSSYQTLTIKKDEIPSQTIAIRDGTRKSADVILSADSDFSILMKVTDNTPQLTAEIQVENSESNDPDAISGKVVFYLDGQQAGAVDAAKKIVTYERNTQSGIDSMTVYDWVSIAVLAVMMLYPVLKRFSDFLKPPGE